MAFNWNFYFCFSFFFSLIFTIIALWSCTVNEQRKILFRKQFIDEIKGYRQWFAINVHCVDCKLSGWWEIYSKLKQNDISCESILNKIICYFPFGVRATHRDRMKNSSMNKCQTLMWMFSNELLSFDSNDSKWLIWI